ncbi:MAG: PHP domain-containing protein [Candidatus Aenigmatarchaeota archaeon]|nr:MAG: PHP domain-containing protein [Candidatus Aenigmarchaeota archaeon]
MKFELHAHTFYSSDAIVSPEDFVKTAKIKGMNGIAVTDHNTTKGWKRVLAAGKRERIHVIKGEEVRVFHDGRKIGEILALFINEDIKPGEFLEVKDKVKDQGGLLIVAHPFDFLRNHFRMTEEYKDHFDGVETMNARVLFDYFNRKAEEFARKNHLGMIGGSDSHCRYEMCNGYTEADIARAEELQKAIKNRKTKAYGKKTNPLIHTLSALTKIGLFTPKELR